jgi:hypothetical protein
VEPPVLTDKSRFPGEAVEGSVQDGTFCGRLRAITVTFMKKSDVRDAKTLIALKLLQH